MLRPGEKRWYFGTASNTLEYSNWCHLRATRGVQYYNVGRRVLPRDLLRILICMRSRALVPSHTLLAACILPTEELRTALPSWKRTVLDGPAREDGGGGATVARALSRGTTEVSCRSEQSSILRRRSARHARSAVPSRNGSQSGRREDFEPCDWRSWTA